MMKIVVTDGYAENPGDLSWEPLRAFGELTVYDRMTRKRCFAVSVMLTSR